MSPRAKPDFDGLWDWNNPEKTEEKFREILLQFPEDDPDFLELLTQIARAQGLQHKFDKAHHTLDQVERRIGEVPSRARVRYLLERGRVINSSGSPDSSRSCFEHALDLATRIGEDAYAVDALHMLAIVSIPASALDLNLRAIQLAESSSQPKARLWLASLYNNTGWSYHDMGEYASALDMFQKAESARREQGRVPELRIAQWCVARALRSLGRYEAALNIQQQLKKELEGARETDGYVFEEIGECLLALNRPKRARSYFRKAYEVLSKDSWLAEKEPERLQRLLDLGTDSNK